MSGCIALIVAAGSGSRLGGALPKQYTRLAGKPMLRWAVERTLASGTMDAVVCVIGAGQEALYTAATEGLGLPAPVIGGATRRLSVLNGLEAIGGLKPVLVSIQDSARPLVDGEELATLCRHAAMDGCAGAIAALPVADTLKRARNSMVGSTVERTDLWQAQTPQVFRFPAILAAHRAAAGLAESEREALTDDAAVAERSGLKVALVAGRPENFKVTTQADLDHLEQVLRGRAAFETRVGAGYDVHAFAPGDHVMLCGVRVAHDAALAGHSDADVGLHALTDAILGAVGAGDIGQHFPPSDPAWRGAASARFLRHAADLLAARGGSLVNADLTIVCERPKVGPHRQAMVESVASILGVVPDRVSVKATTTERLGFTGRGEGIAAQAVVSVRLPLGEHSR